MKKQKKAKKSTTTTSLRYTKQSNEYYSIIIIILIIHIHKFSVYNSPNTKNKHTLNTAKKITIMLKKNSIIYNFYHFILYKQQKEILPINFQFKKAVIFVSKTLQSPKIYV